MTQEKNNIQLKIENSFSQLNWVFQKTTEKKLPKKKKNNISKKASGIHDGILM